MFTVMARLSMWRFIVFTVMARLSIWRFTVFSHGKTEYLEVYCVHSYGKTIDLCGTVQITEECQRLSPYRKLFGLPQLSLRMRKFSA